MSEVIDRRSGGPGPWSVLTRDNWETQDELLAALTDALSALDGVDDQVVLYDYVETEALLAALLPEQRSRGVTEIQFAFEDYQIRITRDGVIAAKPNSGGMKQLSA